MAETCGYCHEELGERPRMELLCHHFFHTQCVLNELHMDDDLRCASCQEFLYPNEVEEDTQSVHSNPSTAEQPGTRVLNLYNTNRTFRRDIKTYVHAISSMSKPRNEFQALLRRTKAELKEPYALIKARYEGLFTTRKDQLLQSAQYITYKKAFQRTQRLFKKLGTNHRVYSYHLPALTTLHGLKRLRGRFGPRPFRLIQRALRLRLPWF